MIINALTDSFTSNDEAIVMPIHIAPEHFTHIQGAASDTWTIVHNLNRNPSVTVIDSAGTEVFGDITFDSLDQVTLNFSAAFSGEAYLN